MAAEKLPFTARLARIPTWMARGADLGPLVDQTFDSITLEMKTRHDKRKGKGVRANTMLRTRENPLLHGVRTTLRDRGDEGQSTPGHPDFNPRASGRAWKDQQIKRFRGMAPRAVKKYIIQPLAAKWESQ